MRKRQIQYIRVKLSADVKAFKETMLEVGKNVRKYGHTTWGKFDLELNKLAMQERLEREERERQKELKRKEKERKERLKKERLPLQHELEMKKLRGTYEIKVRP